jgi:hypothetical protein
MKLRFVWFISLIACLFIVAAVSAQTDPVSGVWAGDWGPSPGDRNNVTLELKWDGKALSGNVTGGSNVTKPIPLEKPTFDTKTGVIQMGATAAGRRGPVNYVIAGKVEKGVMTGTWSHDNVKGDFRLTKK